MVVDAATADPPGSRRSGLSANRPVAVYAYIAGFSVIVGDVVVDDDCLAPDLLLAAGNIPVVAEILSFPLVHVAIFCGADWGGIDLQAKIAEFSYRQDAAVPIGVCSGRVVVPIWMTRRLSSCHLVSVTPRAGTLHGHFDNDPRRPFVHVVTLTVVAGFQQTLPDIKRPFPT